MKLFIRYWIIIWESFIWENSEIKNYKSQKTVISYDKKKQKVTDGHVINMKNTTRIVILFLFLFMNYQKRFFFNGQI